MWRVAFQQMRSSLGRLSAAAIAIILGTAFVASTLLAGASMEATTYNSVSAQYGDADLVVTSDEGIPVSDAQRIRDIDGVAAADPLQQSYLQVGVDYRAEWVGFAAPPTDDRLSTANLEEGTLPTSDDEIALAADVASRIDVAVGDEVFITWDTFDNPDSDEIEQDSKEFKLSGLLEPPEGGFFMPPGGYMTESAIAELHSASDGYDEQFTDEFVVALQDGANTDAVITDIDAAVEGATTQTKDDRAAQITAQFTGDDQLFTGLLLAFAAVSLAVAALVISNTFTVLVAQRTRALALLRCVGANTGQIRRSVLTEAAILGLVASAIGLGLATGVVAIGLRLLAENAPGVPLDTGIHMGAGVIIATLLTGTIVTVLAAAVPARLATRVSPLAALRPTEGNPERSAGRVRAGLAIGAVLMGVALLGGGMFLAQMSGDPVGNATLLGLAMGILGGLSSLVGILLGAVYLVPAMIRGLGSLAGRRSSAVLAKANAVRNPRRTGSTASALVIGVALVTMMSTGALIAQQTLTQSLGERFAVDLDLTLYSSQEDLSDAQVQVLRDNPGIADVTLLDRADLEILTTDGGPITYVTVLAPVDGELRDVLRSPSVADAVVPGTMVVPTSFPDWYGVENGDEVAIAGPDGDRSIVEVYVSDMAIDGVLVDPGVFNEVGADTAVATAWARIADGANEMDVARDVQTAITDLQASDPHGEIPSLSGGAAERAAYESVISTMLTVVIGLLGVAVVIALVGVANTLSLSVIERRRESAMLRAVGLSRGQLRATLALEGVLIALTGAIIGLIAGVLYGWAGSFIMLSGIGTVGFAVPWTQVGMVVGVALIAGLLASVIPARSALRASPVAALGAQ